MSADTNSTERLLSERLLVESKNLGETKEAESVNLVSRTGSIALLEKELELLGQAMERATEPALKEFVKCKVQALKQNNCTSVDFSVFSYLKPYDFVRCGQTANLLDGLKQHFEISAASSITDLNLEGLDSFLTTWTNKPENGTITQLLATMSRWGTFQRLTSLNLNGSNLSRYTETFWKKTHLPWSQQCTQLITPSTRGKLVSDLLSFNAATLTSLSLNNSFIYKGSEFRSEQSLCANFFQNMSKGLKNCRSLTFLDLSENRLIDGLKSIAEAIANMNNLQTLLLQGNGWATHQYGYSLKSANRILFQSLAGKPIRTLGLWTLHYSAFQAFDQFLASTTTLTKLDASKQETRPFEGKYRVEENLLDALVKGLGANKSLTSINLGSLFLPSGDRGQIDGHTSLTEVFSHNPPTLCSIVMPQIHSLYSMLPGHLHAIKRAYLTLIQYNQNITELKVFEKTQGDVVIFNQLELDQIRHYLALNREFNQAVTTFRQLRSDRHYFYHFLHTMVAMRLLDSPILALIANYTFSLSEALRSVYAALANLAQGVKVPEDIPASLEENLDLNHQTGLPGAGDTVSKPPLVFSAVSTSLGSGQQQPRPQLQVHLVLPPPAARR